MKVGVAVVSTKSDPATDILSGYAHTLVGESLAQIAFHLHNEAAHQVRDCLADSAFSGVFFFAHGRDTPPAIVDHQGMAMIDEETLHLLGKLAVCASCYSLDGFADGALNGDATIIGYQGELLLPLQAGYASEMEGAVLAAQRALLKGCRAGEATNQAREAYQELARRWIKQPSMTAQIYATLAGSNADAIGVKGDRHATLQEGP